MSLCVMATLLYLCAILVLQSTVAASHDRDELYDDVVEEFRPDIPLNVTGGPLTVHLAISPIEITEVTDWHVGITAYVTMSWTDSRLARDPRDGHNEPIKAFPDKLWKPDIELYSSVRPPLQIISPRAIVYSNGQLLYIPSQGFKFPCRGQRLAESNDIEYDCRLTFGSWVYDGNKLDIQLQGAGVNMDSYIPNPAIEILATNASRHETYYSCCPEPYPNIQAEIKFKLKQR